MWLLTQEFKIFPSCLYGEARGESSLVPTYKFEPTSTENYENFIGYNRGI
jgi:hypothetical protein